MAREFEYRLPDGTTFWVPEGTPDEDIMNYAPSGAPNAPSLEFSTPDSGSGSILSSGREQEPGLVSRFFTSAGASTERYIGGLGPAVGAGVADVMGDDVAFAENLDELRRRSASAAEGNPFPSSLEEVRSKYAEDGIGSAIMETADLVIQGAGGSVPYMAAPLATMGAIGVGLLSGPVAWAAVGGSIGLSVLAHFSDNMERTADEAERRGQPLTTEEFETSKQVATALAQAGLEHVGTALTGIMGTATARSLNVAAAQTAVDALYASGYAGRMVVAGAAEGATELGQQAFQRAVAGLDIVPDGADPEEAQRAFDEYLESLLVGGAVGGGLGAGVKFIDDTREARRTRTFEELLAEHRAAGSPGTYDGGLSPEELRATMEQNLLDQQEYERQLGVDWAEERADRNEKFQQSAVRGAREDFDKRQEQVAREEALALTEASRTPEDISAILAEKGIDTTSDERAQAGWRRFIYETTGGSDLTDLSQPQIERLYNAVADSQQNALPLTTTQEAARVANSLRSQEPRSVDSPYAIRRVERPGPKGGVRVEYDTYDTSQEDVTNDGGWLQTYRTKREAKEGLNWLNENHGFTAELRPKPVTEKALRDGIREEIRKESQFIDDKYEVARSEAIIERMVDEGFLIQRSDGSFDVNEYAVEIGGSPEASAVAGRILDQANRNEGRYPSFEETGLTNEELYNDIRDYHFERGLIQQGVEGFGDLFIHQDAYDLDTAPERMKSILEDGFVAQRLAVAGKPGQKNAQLGGMEPYMYPQKGQVIYAFDDSQVEGFEELGESGKSAWARIKDGEKPILSAIIEYNGQSFEEAFGGGYRVRQEPRPGDAATETVYERSRDALTRWVVDDPDAGPKIFPSKRKAENYINGNQDRELTLDRKRGYVIREKAYSRDGNERRMVHSKPVQFVSDSDPDAEAVADRMVETLGRKARSGRPQFLGGKRLTGARAEAAAHVRTRGKDGKADREYGRNILKDMPSAWENVARGYGIEGDPSTFPLQGDNGKTIEFKAPFNMWGEKKGSTPVVVKQGAWDPDTKKGWGAARMDAAEPATSTGTVVFHASDSVFDEFDPSLSEIGFHFADSAALAENAAIKGGRRPETVSTKEFEIDTDSFVEITGQPNGFTAFRLLEDLVNRGVISDEAYGKAMDRYEAIEDRLADDERAFASAVNKLIRDTVEPLGIKGFAYDNDFDAGLNDFGTGQDVEPGRSFIVLDPKIINPEGVPRPRAWESDLKGVLNAMNNPKAIKSGEITIAPDEEGRVFVLHRTPEKSTVVALDFFHDENNKPGFHVFNMAQGDANWNVEFQGVDAARGLEPKRGDDASFEAIWASLNSGKAKKMSPANRDYVGGGGKGIHNYFIDHMENWFGKGFADFLKRFRFDFIDNLDPAIKREMELVEKLGVDKDAYLQLRIDASVSGMGRFMNNVQPLVMQAMVNGGIKYQQTDASDSRNGVMNVFDTTLSNENTRDVIYVDPQTNQISRRKFSSPDMHNVKKDNTKGGYIGVLNGLAQYGKERVNQFMDYQIAVRGFHKMQQGLPVPVEGRNRAEQAKWIQEKLKLPALHPEIAVAHENFQNFNRSMVDFLLDTEVLSPEEHAAWLADDDFTPFYAEFKKSEGAFDKLIGPLGQVDPKAPYKGFFESERLVDPIEAYINNITRMVMAGTANVTRRRVLRTEQILDGARLWDEDNLRNPNSTKVTVKEKGVDVDYEVDDELIFAMMQGETGTDFVAKARNHPVLKWLTTRPADWLRETVTRNPGFIVPNVVRDSLTMWAINGGDPAITAKAIKRIGENIEKIYKEQPISKSGRILRQFGITGGWDHTGISGSTKESAEGIRKTIRQIAGEEKVKGKGNPLWWWEKAGLISGASESATRELVFEHVYENAMARMQGDPNLSDVDRQAIAQAEAIHQAREILNFTRRGNNPYARLILSMAPFMNARIQGLDLLARTGFKFRPAGIDGVDADTLQKGLIRRGAIVAAASVALAMLNYGDDDYERQEDYKKDDNWFVPVPGTRSFITVPIMFELGILFKTIPERMARTVRMGIEGEMEQAMRDNMKTLNHAFFGTFGLTPMIPVALRPMVENFANKSLFMNRAIDPEFELDLDASDRFGPSTSVQAKAMAQGLAPIADALNISPRFIDAQVRTLFGGLGVHAWNSFDHIARAVTNTPTRPSPRATDIMLLRRFLEDEFGTGDRTGFYEMKSELDAAYMRAKNARPGTEARVLREEAPALAIRDQMNKLYNQLMKIRKARIAYMESPASTAEKARKRDELDRLEQPIFEAYRKLRSKYHDIN